MNQSEHAGMSLLKRLRQQFKHYRQNYLTRRQLVLLDDTALKDIGITRAEALHEARKPFWKGGQPEKNRTAQPEQTAEMSGVFPSARLGGGLLILIISLTGLIIGGFSYAG